MTDDPKSLAAELDRLTANWAVLQTVCGSSKPKAV